MDGSEIEPSWIDLRLTVSDQLSVNGPNQDLQFPKEQWL